MKELADVILTRRSEYISEKQLLKDELIKLQARLVQVEHLIFGCEVLLREEGVDLNSIDNNVKAINNTSEDGRNNSAIILDIIKDNPDGLTPKEVIEKIKEIGHQATDKTIYNVLFILKRDKKIKKVEGKYYLADEAT